ALEVVRAVTDAVGAARVGIRLSPVTPANDAFDPDPQPLFDYLVRELAAYPLAYVHLIEGATGGLRELPDRPFDYVALRRAYRAAGGRGAWMINNGLDKALAEQVVREGADLVAFGRPFIGNPDLVERLRRNKPFAASDRTTWYGGGAKGYTDYPTLGKS
ncbi:MAG: alkene reductase, partial [Rhodoferax sp.]|nr:alkene reductase [Rhodoferax sp.]